MYANDNREAHVGITGSPVSGTVTASANNYELYSAQKHDLLLDRRSFDQLHRYLSGHQSIGARIYSVDEARDVQQSLEKHQYVMADAAGYPDSLWNNNPSSRRTSATAIMPFATSQSSGATQQYSNMTGALAAARHEISTTHTLLREEAKEVTAKASEHKLAATEDSRANNHNKRINYYNNVDTGGYKMRSNIKIPAQHSSRDFGYDHGFCDTLMRSFANGTDIHTPTTTIQDFARLRYGSAVAPQCDMSPQGMDLRTIEEIDADIDVFFSSRFSTASSSQISSQQQLTQPPQHGLLLLLHYDLIICALTTIW